MRYVLFVCNHNAGRSQMAQAFFERLAPDDLRAESAGTEPAQAVWPEVVEVMREVGLDPAGAKPKKLTREMQLHADWAVTMGCGDSCPFVPTVVEDWDLADPAGRPIEEVREIRDEIERRVEELIRGRAEQIRADRTAHEARLAQILPPLAREFAGRRSDTEIRECADAILARFDDVPVRTHVVTLAVRQTRECLRRDHCDALAGR
jgi:arsenate reductase (thioredoxin)